MSTMIVHVILEKKFQKTLLRSHYGYNIYNISADSEVILAVGAAGHLHGVPQRLVAGGVHHVPERLLGVLDASSLRVPVPQEHQLLLLAGPQPAHTLLIDL